MQTGPRTADGKATSSMNAMSHGLTSNKVVLPGEDPVQFEHLRRALFGEHRPATPTESLLVEEIAQAHWRLERVRRRQDQEFDSVALDTKVLSLLHRYATSYERSFFKSLATLKKLQHDRLAQLKAQSNQGFVSQASHDAAFLELLETVTAPPKPRPHSANVEEIAQSAA